MSEKAKKGKRKWIYNLGPFFTKYWQIKCIWCHSNALPNTVPSCLILYRFKFTHLLHQSSNWFFDQILDFDHLSTQALNFVCFLGPCILSKILLIIMWPLFQIFSFHEEKKYQNGQHFFCRNTKKAKKERSKYTLSGYLIFSCSLTHSLLSPYLFLSLSLSLSLFANTTKAEHGRKPGEEIGAESMTAFTNDGVEWFIMTVILFGKRIVTEGRFRWKKTQTDLLLLLLLLDSQKKKISFFEQHPLVRLS